MAYANKIKQKAVIATGVTTRIRDFIKMSFAHVGIELDFEGTGVEELAKLQIVTILNIKCQLDKL